MTAIRELTTEAAYTGFEEADKETLDVRKLADLVVLSEDPYLVSPSSIAQIKVTQTTIGAKAEWNI